MQLKRIEIDILPENLRSHAVPERLGYKKENVLKSKIIEGVNDTLR